MTVPQRFLCIHGHFYQPPRENAWLESIEVQDSAAPYHDWNARINRECYAANGSSRILNHQNKIVRIVNNYSRMSFNFGPTLLAWMEKSAPLTYQRVLDADRVSQERFGGHGSAMAQVYNHIILPLTNSSDRITQIRWGIADFESRFGRTPEGMWLSETAVDLESLDLLAQHGIRFTVLAPHQCARVRAISTERDPEAPIWHQTPQSDVDPTQPYLVRTMEGRSIAVFFYDGPISRAVAFEGLLDNGEHMATRLLHGYRENGRPGQLVHIATDGETYGHHHRHGDMALAYAFQWIEENSDVQLTNYGQFLAEFPPAYEAEIYENTSWSCAHGIERWRSDCGCGNIDEPGWNQKWRAPLRTALDSLRDAVRPLWTGAAAQLFNDAEAARDGYIHVLLNRSPVSQHAFFDKYVAHPPDAEQSTKILKLMELERHIQLMYTSCGWFFDDLAGIETVQIISYAGRVLQLAAELFGNEGIALETEFLARLAEAKSNVPGNASGADIYRKSVTPQRTNLEQVGARYAIVSLFVPQPEKSTRYCYDIECKSCEILTSGRGHFTYGQVGICSQVTLECIDVDFAVLHLGDQNLSATVRKTDAENGSFKRFETDIRAAITQADLPKAMSLFSRDFGPSSYSLSSLFRDDQRRILKILLDSTLDEMETTLRTIYEDHISLLRYLSLTGMPKPQALMLAAEFTLNADLRQALPGEPFDADRVRQLLAQAHDDAIRLDAVSLSYLANQRMLQAITELQQHHTMQTLETTAKILDVLLELPFEVDFWEAQNRWYKILQEGEPVDEARPQWSQQFRELGTKLGIEVDQLMVEN
ncbi:MAG: DUF3536 domain-containing protein [Acidobacteriaceae bacterium]